MLQPIYQKLWRPMKVAVLFSGGASAVPFMLNSERFRVVGGVSSNSRAKGIERLRQFGIPVKVLDIREFYGSRPITDMAIRREYDARLVELVSEWEPDVVACSGYMYVLTEVFLSAFPLRVLNVHPADLRIMEGGRRKYAGLHAVEKQIQCGERETRSTIHLMTEDVDHGPIICISPPLPVENRTPAEQQELMKQRCDGPAYRKALELISEGKLALDEQQRVYHRENGEWVEGPYVMEG